MSRLSPNDLLICLAISRHRNIRKAGDELGVTASALSHSLRGIEEKLKVRLFNRTTRSIAPTEAGERLFDRIAPAFRDIDDALDDLNTFRDTPSGDLRINAARSSAETVLVDIVARFIAAYPNVGVEITVENALVDMVSQGFDAGVRFGEILAQDMIAIPLGPPQRNAYVASPAFFRRFPMPTHPEQLKTLPCIRFRFHSGRYYAWEFKREDTELAVEVQGPLTVGEQDLGIRAALRGTGIAFAFEDQVRDHLAQGTLVRVLEDWCPHYAGYHLYYPSRRQLPATLRAFVDFVRGTQGGR